MNFHSWMSTFEFRFLFNFIEMVHLSVLLVYYDILRQDNFSLLLWGWAGWPIRFEVQENGPCWNPKDSVFSWGCQWCYLSFLISGMTLGPILMDRPYLLTLDCKTMNLFLILTFLTMGNLWHKLIFFPSMVETWSLVLAAQQCSNTHFTVSFKLYNILFSMRMRAGSWLGCFKAIKFGT